jgi:hypothetical protein
LQNISENVEFSFDTVPPFFVRAPPKKMAGGTDKKWGAREKFSRRFAPNLLRIPPELKTLFHVRLLADETNFSTVAVPFFFSYRCPFKNSVPTRFQIDLHP